MLSHRVSPDKFKRTEIKFMLFSTIESKKKSTRMSKKVPKCLKIKQHTATNPLVKGEIIGELRIF